MKNTRGQEEIVGFVAVVVLIAVVALVFLAFSLRSPIEKRESVTIAQFLESAQEYTTECALRFVPDYARLEELFGACREGKTCVNGEDTCDVLNQTVKALVEAGLRPGADRPLKGYEFQAVYLANVSLEGGEAIIPPLRFGNCSSSLVQRGVSDFRPSGTGAIRITLETC